MKLNELMTSDFVGGHSPDEMRNFLIEFRKNYRILHSEVLYLNRELQNKNIEIGDLTRDIEEIQKRNEYLMSKLNRRGKLTWRERIFGKINK